MTNQEKQAIDARSFVSELKRHGGELKRKDGEVVAYGSNSRRSFKQRWFGTAALLLAGVVEWNEEPVELNDMDRPSA